MDRLHGVPLTDLAAIRSMSSADPEQTLITALNTWFGSVLGCETFHADVHAGDQACAHVMLCVTFTSFVHVCKLSLCSQCNLALAQAAAWPGNKSPARRVTCVRLQAIALLCQYEALEPHVHFCDMIRAKVP